MNTGQKGAEEARTQLSHLLDAAERGDSTIITKRGRPVAAIVPVKDLKSLGEQQSLLPLEGSGKGLWGANSAAAARELRDEWSR